MAKHHRASECIRGSVRGRTPLDVWLRRQMKAEHDSSLHDPLPSQWLELVHGAASERDDQNSP